MTTPDPHPRPTSAEGDDRTAPEAAGALAWTDDHCHLHYRDAAPEAVAEAVAVAREAGVARMITVGCDLADSEAAIAAAGAHDGVYATVGVHPHEAAGGIDGIEALLAAPHVVAVGECGMDLYYEHSPRDAQREVFAAQIALAHAHDLALVIHTRDAWDDTFDVLAAEGVPERTILHCFSGGPSEARRCLDLGAFLSFSGIITFKSAQDLREAAALCPIDRVLVETGAPYLAPVPHRGKPNRPALVPLVGAGVAAAMGRPVAEVAAASWDNATRAYRLPA
ncbi:TatD family hydrolase [Aquihabitans sp. G128]|uniref:TatD family hydrolase n=1 Tax=Aquihabitans sp. G128 TaxID=2849779 RepID=UPI001C21AE32|nr:TatD family hydrolase [Aquihabitans sp. G128]QXC60994.1 TatD family hydrolase [Aquihabitans sp. G128]